MTGTTDTYDFYLKEFPSRNQGSFNFKSINLNNFVTGNPTPFPSHNRGSFNFKREDYEHRADVFLFRSRNRGSFGFKHSKTARSCKHSSRFNLVIEVLLVSRNTTGNVPPLPVSSFDLVIEVLLISRKVSSNDVQAKYS